MRRAKRRIKEYMPDARKTENLACPDNADYAKYISPTQPAEMPDFSDRRIERIQKKDEFEAMYIPVAIKHTLEARDSALEPEQPHALMAGMNLINRAKDPYFGWKSALDNTFNNQIEQDIEPVDDTGANGLQAFIEQNYGSRFCDIPKKTPLKSATKANPVIPSYVPREHWLSCALGSLGFK